MIEIPTRFAGNHLLTQSVHNDQSFIKTRMELGSEGIAEDLRYYGKWIHDEAKKASVTSIPRYKITREDAEDRKT